MTQTSATAFSDGKDPEALRTIGEVAKALGIRQHVLRYWEEQFPMLRPLKRSGGRYAPVTVAYASQGGITGGRITGRTVSGDHPETTALTSGIDPTKSVNRYWSLAPEAGTNIGTYDAIFQFCNAAGCGGTDIDAAANPANFIVAQKAAAWASLTPAASSATSQRVNGLTGFGEFAIGEAAVPAARLAKTVSTPSASTASGR